MAAFLLLTMVSGCKELDKLAELDEIESLLERMNAAHGGDSLDMTLYDSITFDSVHKMMTVIKKVRLEGHDYWTIVGVGERMGGTGITHSESCWCHRFKTAGTR